MPKWNVNEAEYHRDATRVGSSMLRDFRQDRRRFYGVWIQGSIPQKKSAKLVLGSAVHVLTLTPSREDELLFVAPRGITRRQQAFERIAQTKHDQIVLTSDEFDVARRIADSVLENPLAKRLLKDEADNEIAYTWKEPESGLNCKVRFDALKLVDEDAVIVDLKTTSTVEPRAFRHRFANYQYHAQAALYRLAFQDWMPERDSTSVTVAVQNEPPYTCAVYQVAPSALALGEQTVLKDLVALAESVRTNEWQNPWEAELLTLDLPRWAYIEAGE